ncbi:MAG: DEAD/DEAH box helicase [Oscillospiraceae bacterium]|nr:DEAD/DEAH box helicase [Oscillospiraceae bacterium]
MITEFEALVTAHQLPRETLQRVEQRLSNNGTRKFELTALQKEVLNDPNFWSDTTSNIVIQGATSSGKTLLSEIAAISCLSHNQGHRSQVIVLVPLKAMVHERWKVFSGDLDEKRVFAASADYQDHDGDLVQGEYDVAIIVYEKFFALIAQYGSRLLDKCGLLIVDEIQMLSTNGRGPKLEFSLQRVLEWYQDIRIMGLTTNHTKVNSLRKWMNVSYVLGNSKRPVALEEYIIATNGKGWKHVEHGDSGSANLAPVNGVDDPIEAYIELDSKLPDQASVPEHKNNLLVSLMRDIQRKDTGKLRQSKIIIFANSRNKTRFLAKLLCQSGLYERRELPKSLYEQVEKVDNDEFQMELLENMLPYGIAFHNSALPVSLRQVIENDFSDTNGAINIIVATETLTIGMNMPTDIMVLYDKTVYRGDHTEHELLPQEYKNFIGRAGRLGFDKAYGQSYLLVSPKEISNCWHYYVFPEQVEIVSSLPSYEADNSDVALQHAPYYLNIMTNLRFSAVGQNMVLIDRLAEVEAHSFGNCCKIEAIAESNAKDALLNDRSGEKGSRSTDRVREMLKWLERAQLLNLRKNPFTQTETAELRKYGECMSPYALSCHTCFDIYTYLVCDGLSSPGDGGLPYDVTAKEIQNDKYLLDILFRICLTSEVEIGVNLNAPEDNLYRVDRFTNTVSALLGYLDKYKKEHGVWKNSPLEEFFNGNDTPTTSNLNALIRAVILLHWTKGQTVKEIKKETGLSKAVIITGDVERLAEVCSYQIEALSKAINVSKNRLGTKLSNEFYYLSTRVKYGMGRELVPIANRHIITLDRKTILKIGRLAKKHSDDYENAIVFLKEAREEEFEKAITMEMRDQIVSTIDQRYLQNSFTNLLERLCEDQILEQDERDVFLTMYQFEDGIENKAAWERAFENIMNKVVNLTCRRYRGTSASCYLLQFDNTQDKARSLMIYFSDTDTKEGQDFINVYEACQNDDTIIKLIIVGKYKPSIPIEKNVLHLSLFNFCGIIAQYLAETSGTGSGKRHITWGRELLNLLNDQYGVISGYAGKNLQPLMMNYISRSAKMDASGPVDVILVRDLSAPHTSYASEIVSGLRIQGKTVQIYTWGQLTRLEQPEGLIVYLLNGRYINCSKGIWELSKKYNKNSFALWQFQEDRESSQKEGLALRGNVCSDAEKAVNLILEQLEALQTGRIRKYYVGISYKHHDNDPRVALLAEKLKERYGEERILFDGFHEDLFSTKGAGSDVEMLFRTECCFTIIGITNDYDGSGWHKNEYRGINHLHDDQIGYLMLERLNDPENFAAIDVKQDGTVEFYTNKAVAASGEEEKRADEELEKAFQIFQKNIDKAIKQYAVKTDHEKAAAM